MGPWLAGGEFHGLAMLGIFVSLWIILATIQYVIQSQNRGIQQAAMVVAHIGIAIMALGISVNKSYSEERQVKMSIGETVTLAGYHFTFEKLQKTQGTNFTSTAATFAIGKSLHPSDRVVAEQRTYSHEQTLGKTGIQMHWWGDLYLALGAPLADNSWSVRLYYKPFVRLIWLGGFMLLIGGLLSLLQKMRREKHASH